MEPQPLPVSAPDLPATPLTSALALGSLTSYGPGTVRLPPAPPEISPTSVALLGWLVPGLGQVATGRRRAGLALFLVIVTLFTGGLALTDFSCVDPERHRLEFVAHALIGGPTAATLAATSGRRSSAPPRWRDLGSLYVIVSGFLNLIAVCSALSDAARRNQELRKKHQEAVSLALAVARLQALARRPPFEETPREGSPEPPPWPAAPGETPGAAPDEPTAASHAEAGPSGDAPAESLPHEEVPPEGPPPSAAPQDPPPASDEVRP